MTDEEKKEYEELKSLLYTGTISQYGKRKLIDMFEKQSKKIEELKANKGYHLLKNRRSNMEEDIKVLEEYLNYEVTKRKLSGCEILAIENLIARNKELEEMNEKYKIHLTDEQYLKIIDSVEIDVNKDWKSKVKEKIEELEKEYDQFVEWDREDDCMITREIIEILEDLLQEGDK